MYKYYIYKYVMCAKCLKLVRDFLFSQGWPFFYISGQLVLYSLKLGFDVHSNYFNARKWRNQFPHLLVLLHFIPFIISMLGVRNIRNVL